MICPPDLRERYHQGRLLPFIGAGVSMSVVWKKDDKEKRGLSWSELVDQAAQLLGFQSAELARVRGTDLQILEYFKRKHAGETAKLTNWLSKTMDPPAKALKDSIIHQELSLLSKCKLFYTTNFDDFIERAFSLHGRSNHVVAVEAQMGGTHADCEIIKFHGDLDHPEHIVLTESAYEKRLSLSTAMDYRLRADLLGRAVLFLGYSFRDPNVSYLFRLFTDDILGQRGSLSGERAYIVVPDPSDFEIELFQERKIRVIQVRGGEFLTKEIATLLEEIRG